MADTVDEIAKNIVRNIVPFNAGEDLGKLYQRGEGAVLDILQRLGLMQQPQVAPPLNSPLPKVDPATGQVVYPEGYRGPR